MIVRFFLLINLFYQIMGSMGQLSIVELQELEEGPWSESHVDQGSTMLIPVPGSNGCIIVGEKKIQFFSSNDSSVISIAPSLVKVFFIVDSIYF